MTKYTTPQQFREELLKQTLLNEAFQAKPYYQDGFYKPQTAQIDSAKQQRMYYEKIDQIGYRISTPPQKDPADEANYKNETRQMTSDLLKDIENKFRNGLIPASAYNDLMGYFSEVVQSAQVGEFSKNRAPKEGDVSKLVQNVVGLNLTQLSDSEIRKMLRELGATQKDIKQILSAQQLQQQQNMPAQTQFYRPAAVAGELEPDEEEYIPNISNQQFLKTAGELPEFTNVPQKSQDRQQMFTSASGASGALQSSLYQNYEADRRDIEAEDGETERYGLDHDTKNIVEKEIDTTLTSMLFKNIPVLSVVGAIVSYAESVKRMNPNFKMDNFIARKTNEYKHMFIDKQNDRAKNLTAASAAAAAAGDRLGELMSENERIETNLHGVVGPTQSQTQKQSAAAAGMLPAEDMLGQMIELQPYEFDSQLFKSILEGELPNLEDVDRAVEEFKNDQIKLINTIQFASEIIDSGSPPNPSILKALKAILTPQMYIQIEHNLEAINTEVENENKLKNRLLTVINGLSKAVDGISRQYPVAWKLKMELSTTTQNVESVAEQFISGLIKYNHVDSTQRSREVMKEVGVEKQLAPNPITQAEEIKVRVEEKTIKAKPALDLYEKLLDNFVTNPFGFEGVSNEQNITSHMKVLVIGNIIRELVDDYINPLRAHLKLKKRDVKQIIESVKKSGIIEKGEEQKGKGKCSKKGGSRYTEKEYYSIGAPAMTAQIPDPPMRYIVADGRNAKRVKHNIVIS